MGDFALRVSRVEDLEGFAVCPAVKSAMSSIGIAPVADTREQQKDNAQPEKPAPAEIPIVPKAMHRRSPAQINGFVDQRLTVRLDVDEFRAVMHRIGQWQAKVPCSARRWFAGLCAARSASMRLSGCVAIGGHQVLAHPGTVASTATRQHVLNAVQGTDPDPDPDELHVVWHACTAVDRMRRIEQRTIKSLLRC